MWNKVILGCIGHAVVRNDEELIDITPNKYIAISLSKETKRLVSIEY